MTAGNSAPEEAPIAEEATPEEPLELSRCAIRLREQRKGHGGKTVTVISGLPEPHLDIIAAQLRRSLGTGARRVEETIVVQGGVRQRVHTWLSQQGARRIKG